MQLLRTESWQQDFEALPQDVKSAWLGEGQARPSVLRLLNNKWAFRPEVASGPWYILDTEELLPYLLGLRVPTPYTPPKPVAPPKPPEPPKE